MSLRIRARVSARGTDLSRILALAAVVGVTTACDGGSIESGSGTSELCTDTVTSATIGSAGGALALPDGSVQLQIEPSTFDEATDIGLGRVSTPPEGVLGGPVAELCSGGTALSPNGQLTMTIDPASLGEIPLASTAMAVWNSGAGAWQPLADQSDEILAGGHVRRTGALPRLGIIAAAVLKTETPDDTCTASDECVRNTDCPTPAPSCDGDERVVTTTRCERCSCVETEARIDCSANGRICLAAACVEDLCADEPCKNSGACVPGPTDFTCACSGNFAGPTCERCLEGFTGYPNCVADGDEDGVPNGSDDCTAGATGWTSNSSTDHDGDGCQDFSEDSDDDGDGLADGDDDCPKGDLGWISQPGTDADGDGCRDAGEDTDDDNDGVLDGEDGASTDPTLCGDDDADGCDDCAVGTDGFGPLSDSTPDNDGTDTDDDGLCDLTDACFGTNAFGSAVLDDPDADGICNDEDPCPVDNPDDTDGDGICDSADRCDGNDAVGDADEDGVCSDIDPCPLDNPDDTDGDGVCDTDDVCDGDDATGDPDGDGVCSDIDPCPLDNPDDADGDGICEVDDLCTGDDSTLDPDGDGVCDDIDPCPLDNPDDPDGDGVCESVDICVGDDAIGDRDGDGACDDTDPCPDDNPDDSDGDGVCTSLDICVGDDATGDTDGDVQCDDIDPCPLDNPDDPDEDGVCEAVDVCLGDDATGDSDGDGICNDRDPCPTATSNDTDGDGVCDDTDPCPLDNPDDSDGDGVCDTDDLCTGDDATGDSDGDGVCDDGDLCQGNDATGDSDVDGVCDDLDICLGDDALGDTDFDGLCDDFTIVPTPSPRVDLCFGNNASGDTDDDLVCEERDACLGDDAIGDRDFDSVCDDRDPCPDDPFDDSDGDGSCDSDDLCFGDDSLGDTDSDGICDGSDPCPLDNPDDTDGDGVCDSVDLCDGDDASGDPDGDGVCSDLDPCPLDDPDDADNDGYCDSDPLDLCIGDETQGDSDGDGVCDDRDICWGDDATGDADSDDLCASDDCNDADASYHADIDNGHCGLDADGDGYVRQLDGGNDCDDSVGGAPCDFSCALADVPGCMVNIPAGTYWMGCAPDDPLCDDDELPWHAVTISAAFWIQKYETSQGEYGDCVNPATGPSGCTTPTTGGDCNWDVLGDDHPVNCVTWSQADDYCDWADMKLPTEAQWEYAARGTDGRHYPWGASTPDCGVAMHNDGSGPVAGCGTGSTQPVNGTTIRDSGGESPFGVRHMSGNVSEWVADRYGSNYFCEGNNADTSPPFTFCGPGDDPIVDFDSDDDFTLDSWKNPKGPTNGTWRVHRGGSWSTSDLAFLRTSNRGHLPNYWQTNGLGFRCVRLTGDFDEDGYVSVDDGGDDCDDDEPLVNPGATDTVGSKVNGNDDENCDGIDGVDADGDSVASTGSGGDDCDDAKPGCWTDTGGGACGTDDDGDGYCPADSGDCDDTVGTGAACYSGCATYYEDVDGDGYGDAATAADLCSQPAGYVLDDTDCNDDASTCSDTCTDSDGDGYDDCEDGCLDADDDGRGDDNVGAIICVTDGTTPCPERGLCLGADCDDGVPGCWSTCVDGDSDGFCPADAGDCDDAKTGCWTDVGGGACSTDADNDGWCDADGGDCDDVGAIGAACHAGCGTFYADTDTDGYGDASSTTLRCSVPSGYVANGSDCDDTKIGCWTDAGGGACGTNADGDDYCPGDAGDCDDTAATGDACHTGCTTYYSDTDSDTRGDSGTATDRCSNPGGLVTDGSDCDDTKPGCWTTCVDGDGDGYCPADSGDCDDAKIGCWTDVGGGACGTNLDGDDYCPGDAGDCDDTVSTGDTCNTGCTTYYSDTDSDTKGDPATATDRCTNPGSLVTDGSDCDDTKPYCWTTCVDSDGDGYCPADTGDCDDAKVGCWTDVGGGACGTNLDGDDYCPGDAGDCDDTVETGDTCNTGCTTYYYDDDNDTKGDPVTATDRCTNPGSLVTDGTDCDDTKPGCWTDQGGGACGTDGDGDGYCNGVDGMDCDDTTAGCWTDIGGGACSDGDTDGWCPNDAGDCDDGAIGVNPAATESCTGAVDDDCNGYVDCVDYACNGDAACETGTAEGPGTCTDNLDNDADGWFDCADSGCWSPCSPGGGGENGIGAFTCSDGYDNDDDGDLDCADADCASLCTAGGAEICAGGVDDDSDGLTDCEDPECRGVAGCTENCGNAIDDDFDSLVDCYDLACSSFAACGGAAPTNETVCDDNLDDDGDGLIDCADADCSALASGCSAVAEGAGGDAECGDSVDQDGDGFFNCEDLDCSGKAGCP